MLLLMQDRSLTTFETTLFSTYVFAIESEVEENIADKTDTKDVVKEKANTNKETEQVPQIF